MNEINVVTASQQTVLFCLPSLLLQKVCYDFVWKKNSTLLVKYFLLQSTWRVGQKVNLDTVYSATQLDIHRRF